MWKSLIWWLRYKSGKRTKRSKRKQGDGFKWLVRCRYHLQKWECPVAKLAFKTDSAMPSPKLISPPSTFRRKEPKWWEHFLPRKRMGQISVHGQRQAYFSVIFSWNFWILYYCMYYLIKDNFFQVVSFRTVLEKWHTGQDIKTRKPAMWKWYRKPQIRE